MSNSFPESMSGSLDWLSPEPRHTRLNPRIRQHGRLKCVPAQWAQSCLLNAPAYWSHLLHPCDLFERRVLLKTTFSLHGITSMYLLKHFNCLWRNFPRLDQTFLVYLFIVWYRWFLCARRWLTWKRRALKNKNKKKSLKKCNCYLKLR